MIRFEMEMLLHTCMISLNHIFHPGLSALRMQSSCLSPQLKSSQLAAGPIMLPVTGLFFDYFTLCTCYQSLTGGSVSPVSCSSHACPLFLFRLSVLDHQMSWDLFSFSWLLVPDCRYHGSGSLSYRSSSLVLILCSRSLFLSSSVCLFLYSLLYVWIVCLSFVLFVLLWLVSFPSLCGGEEVVYLRTYMLAPTASCLMFSMIIVTIYNMSSKLSILCYYYTMQCCITTMLLCFVIWSEGQRVLYALQVLRTLKVNLLLWYWAI